MSLFPRPPSTASTFPESLQSGICIFCQSRRRLSVAQIPTWFWWMPTEFSLVGCLRWLWIQCGDMRGEFLLVCLFILCKHVECGLHNNGMFLLIRMVHKNGKIKWWSWYPPKIKYGQSTLQLSIVSPVGWVSFLAACDLLVSAGCSRRLSLLRLFSSHSHSGS